MAGRFRGRRDDRPPSNSGNYGSWETRVNPFQTTARRLSFTEERRTAPMWNTATELANAVQYEHIPKDVSARIHAYHVAQAVSQNRALLEGSKILAEANKYLTTSGEAQLTNESALTIRGKPTYLVDAHLPQTQIHTYADFINRAKKLLSIALLRAGEKTQEKFDYSMLIDFVSRGQKNAFVSRVSPLLIIINESTREGIMRPPEKRFDRDIKLLQTREELSILAEKIRKERLNTYWERKEPQKSRRIIKVTGVDCARVFNLMEQFEESAKRDGNLTKQETLLLQEWRTLKAKVAFSEVETRVRRN